MKNSVQIFSALGVLGVLCLMAYSFQQQTLQLAAQERASTERLYIESKEGELKHYVELSRTAILKIAAGEGEELQKQRQALGILSQMRFGKDGYFFVYDRNGNVLLDPTQMGIDGVNFCEPGHPNGSNQANLLINTALTGGGTVRYEWKKPSEKISSPKMSHVIQLGQWGWIIGSGVYLDDVQATLQMIDANAVKNIEKTHQAIFLTAAIFVIFIAAMGWLMNISSHRIAGEKLRHLARRVVSTQEQERVRVAQELHDGVVQVMVSSKFIFEAAHARLLAQGGLQRKAEHTPQVASKFEGSASRMPVQLLEQGVGRLEEALQEIRRVSHGLRPALLDDLGLPAALARLVQQSSVESPFSLALDLEGMPFDLAPAINTALYRVVQEALSNVASHANASEVKVELRFGSQHVVLKVQDNGTGFDLKRIQADGQAGIGLRNMRERVESLGGRFRMKSGVGGTVVRAEIPRFLNEESLHHVDNDA